MTTPTFFRIGGVSVVDVEGADATAIVHNLTTNEIKTLEVGDGCETFVTDVRGKTLGHFHLYREAHSLRMIGAPGQSERVAAHVDRYTIREDATATIRDAEFAALVLDREAAAIIGVSFDEGRPLRKESCRIGATEVDVYHTRWLGESTALLLAQADEAGSIGDAMVGQSIIEADESAFHRQRTMAGFPWMGIDLDESNLPQEADRDPLAVSFTKGCYLGQETVARLDALGQVQKKLVRWSLRGGIPEPGAKLVCGEKTVGRLTSIAVLDDGGATAIGFARRSHFDPGSTATGVVEADGAEFTGTVL